MLKPTLAVGSGTQIFNPRNGNGRAVSRNQPVGMDYVFSINAGMKLDAQSSFVISQDW